MTSPIDVEPDVPSVPQPTRERPRGLGSLLFRQPEETGGPIPSPSSSPEAMEESGGPLDASPSDSGWQPDDLDESSPDTPSTASSSRKPFRKAATRATVAKAVLIGSAMAHRIAARTEGQQAVGLYLADEEDAENLAEPLANIAGRRGGIAGGIANPDTADAVAALMGVANYVSKQLVKGIQAAEFDRQAAGGAPVGGPVDV